MLCDDCYLVPAFLAASPHVTSALWSIKRWTSVLWEATTVCGGLHTETKSLLLAETEKEASSAGHGEGNMQSQQKVWEEGSSDAETQQEHQQFTASCSRVVCFLFQHLRSTEWLLFFGLFSRFFSNRKFNFHSPHNHKITPKNTQTSTNGHRDEQDPVSHYWRSHLSDKSSCIKLVRSGWLWTPCYQHHNHLKKPRDSVWLTFAFWTSCRQTRSVLLL